MKKFLFFIVNMIIVLYVPSVYSAAFSSTNKRETSQEELQARKERAAKLEAAAVARLSQAEAVKESEEEEIGALLAAAELIEKAEEEAMQLEDRMARAQEAKEAVQKRVGAHQQTEVNTENDNKEEKALTSHPTSSTFKRNIGAGLGTVVALMLLESLRDNSHIRSGARKMWSGLANRFSGLFGSKKEGAPLTTRRSN